MIQYVRNDLLAPAEEGIMGYHVATFAPTHNSLKSWIEMTNESEKQKSELARAIAHAWKYSARAVLFKSPYDSGESRTGGFVAAARIGGEDSSLWFTTSEEGGKIDICDVEIADVQKVKEKIAFVKMSYPGAQAREFEEILARLRGPLANTPDWHS